MQLYELDQPVAVCRLPPDASIPGWVAGELTSVTRRHEELSIICAASSVPPDVTQEGPFVVWVVTGPLAFDAVGILAALAAPLAEAQIPILAVGTYDTDVLLVPSDSREAAHRALAAAGHDVLVGWQRPLGHAQRARVAARRPDH